LPAAVSSVIGTACVGESGTFSGIPRSKTILFFISILSISLLLCRRSLRVAHIGVFTELS